MGHHANESYGAASRGLSPCDVGGDVAAQVVSVRQPHPGQVHAHQPVRHTQGQREHVEP